MYPLCRREHKTLGQRSPVTNVPMILQSYSWREARERPGVGIRHDLIFARHRFGSVWRHRTSLLEKRFGVIHVRPLTALPLECQTMFENPGS